MPLYCGLDLHSNNTYAVVIDDQDVAVFERRLPNDLKTIVAALEPYREEIAGVAVESTFNWYWLVDGLMDAGHHVELVNPAAAKRYDGLKFSDDRHDARWLAHLLRLGILPTGFICPKKDRAVRDLMRRRIYLVRKRASFFVSVNNLIARNTGLNVTGNALRALDPTDASQYASDPEGALAIELTLKIGHLHRHPGQQTRPQDRDQSKEAQREPAAQDHPGRRSDSRGGHPLRDRQHRPIPGGGQLRLVLSLRSNRSLQQREAQRAWLSPQRESLPVLGLRTGCLLRPTLQ